MLRKERRSLSTFITRETKTSPFTGRSCACLKERAVVPCLHDIYSFISKRGLQYITLKIKSNLKQYFKVICFSSIEIQLMPLVTMIICCCMPSFVTLKISTSFNV